MGELAYNGDNPGSVQYGNFINYYQFHPAATRINLLPKNIECASESDSFTALDIGCNAGDLTVSLLKYIEENICKNANLLGIDIDSILIERANENNTFNNVIFKCVDFMNSKERNDLITEYFESLSIKKFNAIYCFSITMWIHLNHGDSGLGTFLKEICKVSDMVIIEPQPWKCYRSAVKRMKLYQKEFSHFKYLKYKIPERDIEKLILQQNFQKTYEVRDPRWNRKILIFKRNCI